MRGAPLQTIGVTRGGAPLALSTEDDVVVEEPLDIRVAGDTLAITMRTPGTIGSWCSAPCGAEGVIASLSDVSAIAHCGRPGDEGYGNTIEVTPAPGARLRLPGADEALARRGTLVTSACGVCGRRSIDDLLERCAKVEDAATMSPAAITRAVEALRPRQPVFAKSGGCHAASLVSLDGEHVATFDDVGRHNALDKLVGASMLAGRLPASGHALVVSGRTSFEIVQKAVVAGIPIIIGVSASSGRLPERSSRAGDADRAPAALSTPPREARESARSARRTSAVYALETGADAIEVVP